MSHAASLRWFAAHELRLAWRDWSWMLSGGRRVRNAGICLVLLVFAIGLHAVAWHALDPVFADGLEFSKPVVLVLGSGALLAFTMMLSQALEMVTRGFYTRDDLELILSSPSPAGDLFAVRLAMLALSNAVLSLLFVSPFINVAVVLDGWHWLSGYAVVIALAMISTALATGIVLGLFASIGARRTRLAAQITAAVVSASFLIGVQAVAILSFNSVSRWSVLTSDWLQAQTPDTDSSLWLVSYAVAGDPIALITVVVTGLLALGFASYVGSRQFQGHVLTAASAGDVSHRSHSRKMSDLSVRSVRMSLMIKEWRLLARDPWLISQTLMQCFYLIPPGLMLWVTFGENNPMAAIVAPVVVMAVSQLAGGLAWLAISGEDAPDLVLTAPISGFDRAVSKISAVLAIVFVVALPFVLGLAAMTLWGGIATALGVLLGSACTIAIQLIFHVQAKRSLFRRRQVASKASTFCEAFAAILCAAATGILAAGHYALVGLPLFFLALVMVTAWLLRPRG